MGCCRGQPRSAPTESSSTELSGKRRPLTRNRRGRSRATISRPEPVPTTGSAIFTFDSTLNRPRITAYFTVVFHEESQAKDIRTQSGNSRAIPALYSSLQLNVQNAPWQAANEQTGRAQEAMMVDPNSAAQNATQVEDWLDMGWCRIIEKPLMISSSTHASFFAVCPSPLGMIVRRIVSRIFGVS